jgi:outer membrane protein, heavy metal efflux system
MLTITTRTELVALASTSLITSSVLFSGCAPHSTEGDRRTIRAQLAEMHLPLPEHQSDPFADADPAIAATLSRPLDVEAAVRLALLGNRELRASLAELGIPRGRLVSAGLLPNPQLEFEARVPQAGSESTQFDFGVAFDITQAILAPVRAEVASARMEEARIRAAALALDIAYRTRIAFYRAQERAQDLELLRTAMDSFGASVEVQKQLRAAGNVPEVDVALEEAAYEESRLEVARAEVEYYDARERLNVLLGLHGSVTEWTIADRLAPPSLAPIDEEALERRALEASLELRVTRAQLEVAQRELGLARTMGLVPDIFVGVRAPSPRARPSSKVFASVT